MSACPPPPLNIAQRVHVTVLGGNATDFFGKITSCSGLIIGLIADKALHPGDIVKVECRNTLFLGEVQECSPDGDGFKIGLYLEHALYHTEELARLARRLLAEDYWLEEIEQWSGPSEK
jgi:hypothetical protein